MERLSFKFNTGRSAGGTRPMAIVGVVASGNLEVLLERTLPQDRCTVEVASAANGFASLWEAVLNDFVARYGVGGLRITVNDAGARPDTVALRLAQGVRTLEQGP